MAAQIWTSVPRPAPCRCANKGRMFAQLALLAFTFPQPTHHRPTFATLLQTLLPRLPIPSPSPLHDRACRPVSAATRARSTAPHHPLPIRSRRARPRNRCTNPCSSDDRLKPASYTCQQCLRRRLQHFQLGSILLASVDSTADLRVGGTGANKECAEVRGAAQETGRKQAGGRGSSGGVGERRRAEGQPQWEQPKW